MLWFISGIVVGAGLVILVQLIRPSSGTLKVDRSNPNKDLYLFEVSNLPALKRKKTIILKVDNHAKLSSLSQK